MKAGSPGTQGQTVPEFCSEGGVGRSGPWARPGFSAQPQSRSLFATLAVDAPALASLAEEIEADARQAISFCIGSAARFGWVHCERMQPFSSTGLGLGIYTVTTGQKRMGDVRISSFCATCSSSFSARYQDNVRGCELRGLPVLPLL